MNGNQTQTGAAIARAEALPVTSPFFSEETGIQAGKRLRTLITLDNARFNEAMWLVMKRQAQIRQDTCAGAALITGQGAILGGWNVERVVPCDSLAKLCVAFAFFQLHADVAFLGAATDLRMASSVSDKVDALQKAIAEAFTRANDPALQQIGRTPAQMPRLSRLFDLPSFVSVNQAQRSQQTLGFSESPSRQQQNAPDNWTSTTRLETMLHVSNNQATTSLMADLGVPFITAWLKRSGLAHVSGESPALWLTTPYGAFPRRSAPDPQAITVAVDPVTVTGGPSKGQRSGQAASVLALTVALLRLQQGKIVNAWASETIRGRMASGAMLADGLKKANRVVPNSERNKVGIDSTYRRYSEAVLLTTQAAPASASAAPGAPIIWSGVVLDVWVPSSPRREASARENEQHATATRIFSELGTEFETELARLGRG